MNIHLTSDQHFFHGKIISMCDRPVEGYDENKEIFKIKGPLPPDLKAKRYEIALNMNEMLIENHNKQVSKKDTVYFVGDFAWQFKHKREVKEVFDRLNGIKHLIVGNHDDREVRDLKWKSISEYKVINVNKRQIVLFHYPMVEHEGYFHGAGHAFGHVHSSQKRAFNTSNKLSYDVGVDNNDMRPISVEEFLTKIPLLPERKVL